MLFHLRVCCNDQVTLVNSYPQVQITVSEYQGTFHKYFIVLQKLEKELKEKEADLTSLKDKAEKVANHVSDEDAGLVEEHIR